MKKLDEVINNTRWESIKELMTSSDYELDYDDVERVFLRAAAKGELGLIDFLFTLPEEFKPTTIIIGEATKKAAHEGQWTTVHKLLRENTLRRLFIEDVLTEAIKQNQWNIINELIGLQGKNKPSGLYIESVLLKAAQTGQIETLKRIFTLTEINKPTQYAIDSALYAAIEADSVDSVVFLLKHTGENKPSESRINLAFHECVKRNKWHLMHLFPETVSAPIISPSTLIERTADAAIKGELTAIPQMLKWLSDSSRVQLINTILVKEGTNEAPSVVPSLLSLMSDDMIEALLLEAIALENSKLIDVIIRMTGDNKPKAHLIHHLLQEAIKAKKWPLVCTLVEKNDVNAGAAYIGKALKIIAQIGDTDALQLVLSIKGKAKPSPLRINAVLHAAVDARQIKVIQVLMAMDDESKPTKDKVREVIQKAIETGQLDIVRVIAKRLSKEDIDYALDIAVKAEKKETILLLIECVDSTLSKHELITQMLLEACRTDRADVVTLLIQEVNRDIVAQLLDEAVKLRSANVVHALTENKYLYILSPAKITDAFVSAAESNYLDLVKILSKNHFVSFVCKKNALATAIKNEAVDIIPFLLEETKIESYLLRGMLLEEIKLGHLKVIRYLLERKVEPKLMTYDLGALLQVAFEHRQFEVIDYLLSLNGENKLPSYVISELFQHACKAKEWLLIQKMLLIAPDEVNRISFCDAIISAMDNKETGVVYSIFSWPLIKTIPFYAKMSILDKAIEYEQYELIRKIIVNIIERDTSSLVNNAFNKLLATDNWNIINLFLEPSFINLASSVFIQELLNKAITANKWDVVARIVPIMKDKAMSEDIMKAWVTSLEAGVYLDVFSTVEASYKELGNRLGLAGVFEGNTLNYAVHSSRLRFSELVKKDKTKAPPLQRLNLLSISEALKKDTLSDFLAQKEPCYQSLGCRWNGHAFSVTLFKEKDKIHVVYVNRGQRMEERGGVGDDPVMVYTLEQDASSSNFLKTMHAALAAEDRTKITDFFAQDEVRAKKNVELSSAFRKSLQKVGNCGFANTNMTWHFALACNYMKEYPATSLNEAFIATRPIYKQMRMEDRVRALQSLLHSSDAAVRAEGVKQFLRKEKKLQQPEYAKLILSNLTKEEIDTLKQIEVFTEMNAWSYLLHLTDSAQANQWELKKQVIDKLGTDKNDFWYVRSTLKAAITAEQWDLVKAIMELKGANKPTRIYVEEVLRLAVEKELWVLVESILDNEAHALDNMCRADTVFAALKANQSFALKYAEESQIRVKLLGRISSEKPNSAELSFLERVKELDSAGVANSQTKIKESIETTVGFKVAIKELTVELGTLDSSQSSIIK